MNENETLREQMWDLCYGLLSAEEVAALHKQIKSDPAAARLYAEVRLQADLVASAAKIEDESVSLSVPDEGRKVQPAAKNPSVIGESPFKSGKAGKSGRRSSRTRSFRMANWLAGLAAVVLVGLIGYGFYAPAKPSVSSVPDTIVASVYSNQPIQSGLSHKFRVVATDGLGQPTSRELSYFVTHGGKVVEENTVRTNELGEAELNVSGAAIRPGAVLEVATHEKHKWAEQTPEYFQHTFAEAKDGVAHSANLVVPLAANPEPVISDVRLEQDSYEPGDTCRFWIHSWRAFTNQPAIESDAWKLVDQDGREIPPANIQVNEEAGIVSGEFQIPVSGSKGFYSLRGVNQKAGTADDLEQVPVGVEAERLAGLARRSNFAADGRYRMLSMQRETLAEMATDKADAKQLEKSAIRQKDQLAFGEGSRSGGLPAPAPGATPSLPAPSAAPTGPKLMVKAPEIRGVAPLAASLPREKEATKKELAKAESPVEELPKNGKNALSGALTQIEPGEERKLPAQSQQDGQKSYDRSGEMKGQFDLADSNGNDLVVEVPAPLAHMNLLAVVTKSNVTVARQQYLGRASGDQIKEYKESGAANGLSNAPVRAPATEPAPSPKVASESGLADELVVNGRLTVPLPPEADGELGVTLYDQTVSPPKALYSQIVRRASSRDLNIDIKPEAASVAPDGEMRLKLTVTDRNGNAVPHSHFAARIVKANALDGLAPAESAALASSRYAADKKLASAGFGGPPTALGMAGGLGGGFGGGGKGVGAKDAIATKDPAEKQDKNEAKKEDAPREGKDPDVKVKKSRSVADSGSRDGSAKPGEPAGGAAVAAAPTPAPPAPAAEAPTPAPAKAGQLYGDAEKAPKDSEKAFSEEDRATELPLDNMQRDNQSTTFAFSQLAADRLEIPQEVLLASNDSLIQDAVRADEVAAQAEHARFQGVIGRVVLMVAAGALLLFGLLAILHRPAQAKVWVPAMVVVAGSFGVGCVWLMNGRLARQQIAGNLAFAPDAAPAEQVAETEVRPMAPARSLPPAAMDDTRNEGVMEKGETSGGGIGPTVLPPGVSDEKADNKPAGFGGSPGGGGGGIVSGKSGVAQTADPKSALPQPAAAAKPASRAKPKSDAELESFEKKNEPAPAPPKLRTDDDNRKTAENGRNAKLDKGAVKEADEAKKKSDELGQKADAVKSLNELRLEKRARTAALLWEPNLPANDQGEAQLSVPLPKEEGDYYLLVDVQGPGGVGTVQTLIPVRRPPAPASPAGPAATPAAPATPAKP